jgi:hypothetical protein
MVGRLDPNIFMFAFSIRSRVFHRAGASTEERHFFGKSHLISTITNLRKKQKLIILL